MDSFSDFLDSVFWGAELGLSQAPLIHVETPIRGRITICSKIQKTKKPAKKITSYIFLILSIKISFNFDLLSLECVWGDVGFRLSQQPVEWLERSWLVAPRGILYPQKIDRQNQLILIDRPPVV